MHDPEVIAEHYRQAEASFLLEGLDSSGDLQYQAMKARVIAVRLTSTKPSGRR